MTQIDKIAEDLNLNNISCITLSNSFSSVIMQSKGLSSKGGSEIIYCKRILSEGRTGHQAWMETSVLMRSRVRLGMA